MFGPFLPLCPNTGPQPGPYQVAQLEAFKTGYEVSLSTENKNE